jgi:hypothetical protein
LDGECPGEGVGGGGYINGWLGSVFGRAGHY